MVTSGVVRRRTSGVPAGMGPKDSIFEADKMFVPLDLASWLLVLTFGNRKKEATLWGSGVFPSD